MGSCGADLNYTDADDINFKLIAESTRYPKEMPEGVSEMYKVMEDVRKKSLMETVIRMLEARKCA